MSGIKRSFSRSATSLLAMMMIVLVSTRAAWPAEGGAPVQAVRVSGVIAKPGDWSAQRIQADLADQVKPVEYTARGEKHQTRAVALLALLKAAGAPTEVKMDPSADPKTKLYLLRLAVVVRARDGYTVTFALAELLSDVGNREAWLALEGDGGKPLSENESPLRLIVPGDATPARWVRGVESITVVDPTAAPTTQP